MREVSYCFFQGAYRSSAAAMAASVAAWSAWVAGHSRNCGEGRGTQGKLMAAGSGRWVVAVCASVRPLDAGYGAIWGDGLVRH